MRHVVVEVDINDLASVGAVADTPPWMLPPEAFNQAINVRAQDNALVRNLGWARVFDPPTVAPHFVFPVMTAAVNYWVYAGLTKVYVFDGSLHTEITRVAGNYATSNGYDWNGTLLGGIPILNNNTDIPQSWSPVAPATKLVNLPNWPAANRAKVMRAFGAFLVAFNCTDAGTNRPHTVRWSHPADPGSVPSSWDVTDTTKDTGEVDLSDVQSGVIHDALPLGSIMYVYKENAVYKMRFVGGRKIMDFGDAAWLPTIGILAPRCVAVTGDGTKHVLATRDDIIWHNGNQVQSILNRRQRRRLAAEMDSVNFVSSFMFANPNYREMWFCYPSSGNTFPDRALILNYAEAEDWCVTEHDGITFRHAAQGPIENPSNELWSDNPGETWDQDTGPWATQDRYRVVTAGAAATRLYKLDEGATRDGTDFTSTLQRLGLSILGRKRDGSWIVDHRAMKMFTSMWPKITGSPVSIRIGVQQVVDGAVEWGAAVSYNPATDLHADMRPMQGRAIAIEISWTAGTSGRIDGYKFEVEAVSEF
jgi:hypothetical protein